MLLTGQPPTMRNDIFSSPGTKICSAQIAFGSELPLSPRARQDAGDTRFAQAAKASLSNRLHQVSSSKPMAHSGRLRGASTGRAALSTLLVGIGRGYSLFG